MPDNDEIDRLTKLDDFMRAKGLSRLVIDGDRVEMVRAADGAPYQPTAEDKAAQADAAGRAEAAPQTDPPKTIWEDADLYGGPAPRLVRRTS